MRRTSTGPGEHWGSKRDRSETKQSENDSAVQTDKGPGLEGPLTRFADIEVVQDDGDYEAVVTFFTEFQTQANVEECVINACLAAFKRALTDRVPVRSGNPVWKRWGNDWFNVGYLRSGALK